MIVGDGVALRHGETTAIAYHRGGSPNLVDDMLGVMFRHDFLIELCALTTYHIEQDAVARLVTGNVWVSSPVLCAESPSVARVVDGLPLREAVIFGIEADEVDS